MLSIVKIVQVYGKSAWSIEEWSWREKIGSRNVGLLVIQLPDAAASPRILY